MTQHPESNARTCDVSGIQPVAREIVRRIASVVHSHLGSSVGTLVAHGSAVKGGVIAGSSDVDFVAFVAPGILTRGGELPLDHALRLHRDLAEIDPTPFRYLQGSVHEVGARPGAGFIPGTFHILSGWPDVPIASGDELLQVARVALGEFDHAVARDRLSNALLDHGESRLFRQVRLLCTDVWPTMYQVASLHLNDGLSAWQRSKPEIVALLDESEVGTPIRRWMDAIMHHYTTGESVDSALEAITSGVAFLDAVAVWAHQPPRVRDWPRGSTAKTSSQ